MKPIVGFLCALSSWLCLATAAPAKAGGRSFELLTWKTEMDMGAGMNALTAGVSIAPGPFETISFRSPICYNQTNYSVDVLERKYEEIERLKLGVTARLDWFVASATGELDFSQYGRKADDEVVVVIEATYRNCDYIVDQARLKADALSLYRQDYAQFRNQFGDKFLSVITTGGSVYGLFRVHRNQNEDLHQLSLNLKAQVAGFTVFSLTVSEAWRHLLQTHKVDIQIVSTNLNMTTLNPSVGDFDGFLRFVEQLREDARSPACSGAPDYRNCPSRFASFSDYAEVAPTAPSSHDFLAKRRGLDEMSEVYDELAGLKRAIEKVAERPDQYVIIDAPSGHYLPVGDPHEMESLRQQVTGMGNQVIDRYRACMLGQNCVTDLPFAYPQVLALRSKIPVERPVFPRDCAELKREEPWLADGNYRVYYAGNKEKPLSVGCEQMASATPLTLIGLNSVSQSLQAPRYNFLRISSQGMAHDEVRLYDSLQVEYLDDRLMVSPMQSLHVRTSGSSADGTYYYAFARACSDGSTTLGGNIDLSGLPLIVSPSVQFVTKSSSGRTGAGAVVISPDRRVVDFVRSRVPDCVQFTVAEPGAFVFVDYRASPTLS